MSAFVSPRHRGVVATAEVLDAPAKVCESGDAGADPGGSAVVVVGAVVVVAGATSLGGSTSAP